MTILPVQSYSNSAGGFWVEGTFNLSDDYQRRLSDLVSQGGIQWSSGAAHHAIQEPGGSVIPLVVCGLFVAVPVILAYGYLTWMIVKYIREGGRHDPR